MAKTGMERLEELKKEIYTCIHCKACRFAYSNEPSRKGIGEFKGKQRTVLYEGMVDSCPAGIEYGWEAFWNAGKIMIARCILSGDLEFSDEVRDVIMPCITCGMCQAQCENKIPTVDIIESLRAACVEAGVPLIEKHALVKKLTEERNNPYGGNKDERMKWAKDAGLEKYVTPKLRDVTEGIDEKDLDVIILDIPNPWEAVNHAWNALKIGGYFCSFSPLTTQVENTVKELEKHSFIEMKTFENIQREMIVSKHGMRPSFDMLGHTGYLTFTRKIL